MLEFEEVHAFAPRLSKGDSQPTPFALSLSKGVFERPGFDKLSPNGALRA
ncbi:MAG: hypothetical protein IT478_17915 [Xanthomonadales bacterium]|nr:hypothetical protein [Xanthomonadales bacterium]MCC6563234.1 hypothetical protein [Xanthomonadales bacterium]